MLLAGLQGQAVGGGALGVARDPDDAPGQLALEALADGHVPGVGAAEEQGHPQALGRADGDIGADVPGCAQQRQGQGVGVDGHQSAALVDGLHRCGQVLDRSARRGVGQDRPQQGRGLQGVQQAAGDPLDVGEYAVQAQGAAAGPGHLEALGVQAGVQHHGALRAPRGPGHEHGRLGHGCGLIEQGGAGHRQGGQVADGGLEEQLGLQAPLGDLRLVGRVGAW